MMRNIVLGLASALAIAVLACTSDEPTPVTTPSAVTESATPSATAPPAPTATASPPSEATPLPPSVDAFTGTGPLVTPRSLHTATLLRGGDVLVIGIDRESHVRSAERFRPRSLALP